MQKEDLDKTRYMSPEEIKKVSGKHLTDTQEMPAIKNLTVNDNIKEPFPPTNEDQFTSGVRELAPQSVDENNKTNYSKKKFFTPKRKKAACLAAGFLAALLIGFMLAGYSQDKENKNAVTQQQFMQKELELAEKEILNVGKTRRTTEFRKIQDVLTKTQEDIEQLVKNKGRITGLTTGLKDLDNITEGLHETQLIIIAARPAVGKTAFALNIATAAAKSTKKNIAIFSLEMPAEQLVLRMISSLGQIDNKKLQTGRLENEDYRRINEAISQLADTNIYFHDGTATTASEIQAKCRRLSTQGEGLGLVVIDYLQLIDSSGKYQGARQQEIS